MSIHSTIDYLMSEIERLRCLVDTVAAERDCARRALDAALDLRAVEKRAHERALTEKEVKP